MDYQRKLAVDKGFGAIRQMVLENVKVLYFNAIKNIKYDKHI